MQEDLKERLVSKTCLQSRVTCIEASTNDCSEGGGDDSDVAGKDVDPFMEEGYGKRSAVRERSICGRTEDSDWRALSPFILLLFKGEEEEEWTLVWLWPQDMRSWRAAGQSINN